jgi:AcrR family transcriptional regulator
VSVEPLRSAVRLRRATDSEQKQRKRVAIIAAARELYCNGTSKVAGNGSTRAPVAGEMPSAAAIAAHAGLAKGTVYLYFKSKEDIFLALVDDEFSALLSSCAGGLEQFTARPSAALLIDHFVGSYVHWLQQRPLLLDLASISHGASARGATADELRAMKSSLARNVGTVAHAIAQLTELPLASANALLISTYALSVGLHQTLDYSPAESAILNEAQFAALRPDFWPLLRAALHQLWSGACVLADKPGP